MSDVELVLTILYTVWWLSPVGPMGVGPPPEGRKINLRGLEMINGSVNKNIALPHRPKTLGATGSCLQQRIVFYLKLYSAGGNVNALVLLTCKRAQGQK